MQFEDFKWTIIRTIGLCLLCLSIYQIYNLIEVILSLLDLKARFTNHYSDGSGTFIGSGYERNAEPIYDKIWLKLREFFVLSIMSYYFLCKGKLAFTLLSSKEETND